MTKVINGKTYRSHTAHLIVTVPSRFYLELLRKIPPCSAHRHLLKYVIHTLVRCPKRHSLNTWICVWDCVTINKRCLTPILAPI